MPVALRLKFRHLRANEHHCFPFLNFVNIIPPVTRRTQHEREERTVFHEDQASSDHFRNSDGDRFRP